MFGVAAPRICRGCSRVAIVASVAVWFVLKRMRLGYEARAVGASAGSARAGGISIGNVQMKLFLLSGALAGLVGMQQLLGERGATCRSATRLALGFTGIAVAFLGQNNPTGIMFAAILWGVLARGETAVQIQTDVPREFVIILQGILIISVVVTYQLARRRLTKRQLQRAAGRGGDWPTLRHPRTDPRMGPEGGGRLMPLGDIGAAIGIAFTYFTIIYLTGLGGLFSERSGIVNIGLEGMMIIGTVTGSWGAHHFTLPPRGTPAGLPWGPLWGC